MRRDAKKIKREAQKTERMKKSDGKRPRNDGKNQGIVKARNQKKRGCWKMLKDNTNKEHHQ